MASYESCNSCHGELKLESKTLSCLHSFCRPCFEKHFEGEMNENATCPKCPETLILDELSLSSFQSKSLGCQQLESINSGCDLCSEDGIESVAKNWCHDCQKLFCTGCSSFHKKLHPEHNASDLNETVKGEVIKAEIKDFCSLHQKAKNSYCKICNICLCYKCYQNHLTNSPRCSSNRLSVREETLKQKSQGPIWAEQINNLERSLKSVNERTRNYIEELNLNSKAKCEQLWQNFEEMMKNARQKTEELCEEIRKETAMQVEKWYHLLEENEKILKQLETWRISLHTLLSDSQQDVDVICSLKSLETKLSSQLNKSIPSEERCDFDIIFADWWLKALENLKTENIGLVYFSIQKLPTEHLQLYNQWNVHGWNSDISSINVSDEDGNVFLCDYSNSSIIEYTESGEFIYECTLFDGTNNFSPKDMCSISPDVFVVCGAVKQMIFLERRESTPFLKTKKIIDTDKPFCSVCGMNKAIFACDMNLQVDCFTIEGEHVKTIKIGESWDQFSWPLIRADLSTGNLWNIRIDSSTVSLFNLINETESLLVETGRKITDFCGDEFSHLYFCNTDGIFLKGKELCKFEKKSEELSKIFVSRNKIFVSLKIDGQYLIKIFKIKK